jgi:hypothetical protein
VLDGPLSVWCSDCAPFGCEYGERLSLADGLDREGLGESWPYSPSYVEDRFSRVRV